MKKTMATKGRKKTQKGNEAHTLPHAHTPTCSYGWIPDLPDRRDYQFSSPLFLPAELPEKVDLSSLCPPVYDQGELGSCTANAIGAAHHFDQMKQALKRCLGGIARIVGAFIPSRLFIYFNERVMEGTVDEDAGASIRDGIKSIARLGVPPESEWPYVIAKFRTKPPAACYAHALKHQALTYYRVARSLSEMKGCLAAGYPFVFGFSVYESFESAKVTKTGEVPMPKAEERLLGGHAVLAVGYNDKTQRFIVRNSWGTKWGMKGYFTMPYDYLVDSDLADDFWTVRLVE
jgi:C1A family cysteine protease